MLVNRRTLDRALNTVELHLHAGDIEFGSCGQLLQTLISSMRRGSAKAVFRTESGRSRGSIVDFASRYWASPGSFDVSVYADIVRDCVLAGKLRYAQAELALSAYELVGLMRLAQLLAEPNSKNEIFCLLGSLRRCALVRAEEFMEQVVPITAALSQDPQVPFAQLCGQTRSVYRRTVCRLALECGSSFEQVAADAVRKAQVASSFAVAERVHYGQYLVCEASEGIARDFEKTTRQLRFRLLVYVLSMAALTVLAGLLLPVSLLVASAVDGVVLLALALLVFNVTAPVAETVLGGIAGPTPCLRLDFVGGGLPDHCRVVIALPVVIVNREQIEEVLAHVEWNLLAAADTNVALALLTDFGDGPHAHPSSDELALLEFIRGVVHQEQERGLSVVLLHRHRTDFRDRRWIGWERKRGKLMQLNRLIETGENTFAVTEGSVEKLIGARYVLCLDEDSRISRDCVQLLAGMLAHPLNWPVMNGKGGVGSGYGMVVPRFVTRREAMGAWRFAAPFCGPSGSERDPVDVSRNFLFDWVGITQYPGKGMYDVRAFQEAVGSDVLPQGRILSHDTIEGAVLRCAYDGRSVISEGFPRDPLALLLRTHRWTRGDIQNYLLLWLMPPTRVRARTTGTLFGFVVNTQLRVSLVPCVIATILAAWCLHDSLVTRSAVWAMFIALSVVPLIQILYRVKVEFEQGRRVFGLLTGGVGGLLMGLALRMAGIWTSSWVTLDAILRTCVRAASGRRLFEWRSAASTQASLVRPSSVPGVIPASLSSGLLAIIGFRSGAHVLATLIPLVWAVYPFLISSLVMRSHRSQS